MSWYFSNDKKVFVSFDYDNDKHYYYLLKGWDANKSFKFHFSDYTSYLLICQFIIISISRIPDQPVSCSDNP